MNEKRVDLFDEWAETYDESVSGYEGFPFEGYDEVLGEIARAADPRAGMLVLDLGIGTGRLAARFLEAGCSVWGLDFSVKMLAKAHERLPQVELIKADVLGDWPIDRDKRFDRVVSGYVLHEFDLDSKVRLISRLVNQHLSPSGRMVVGDISFETAAEREAAKKRWSGSWDEARQKWQGSLWDEDEHYWAADEAKRALSGLSLRVEYRQVSFCGGVYVIQPAIASE
ncbi:MAG: methyltransferase domain-containing protein [Candidatus Eisenbacteria bacterium]|nr:methyltransferase domain-containing protein [Candidatus Eisenbacteria bacterium]